jgi:hypothetical protein
MSSSPVNALTTTYKTRVLSRLVAAYTEELLKMLVDDEYKKLSPEQQIQAQNELGHWYQKWFHMIPDPKVSSVDGDDFEHVDQDRVPTVIYNQHNNTYSYWNTLIKNLSEPPFGVQ